MINSPNSASTNALGMGHHHNMDSLMNDQSIPFDASSYGVSNFDMVAKSYPFQLSPFLATPLANFHDQIYLLDDDYKFQVQLYQELRFQVAREDLQKDMTFSSGCNEEMSMSAASTTDTTLLDTPVISIPETVIAADYHLPYANTPTPEKRRVEKPTKPHATEVPVKKHTRKHIMARSRSGCWICRIKHLKCDEIKPVCKNCTRFGIQCDYSADRPDYVSNKELRRQKLDRITTKKRRISRPLDQS